MAAIASSDTSISTLPQVLPTFRWEPDEPSYPLKNRFEDRIQKWHNNGDNVLIDTRTIWERFVDTLICFFELIKLGFEIVIEMCKTNPIVHQYTYDVRNEETLKNLDNEPSDRPLYIFMSGFGGNPILYTKHVQALEERYRDSEIQPDIRIIKNYSASERNYENLLIPLQEMLGKYCNMNPDNKVFIAGKSLGGLLVSDLEYSMRNSHPKNHLFVASMVGAYGSKLVSFLVNLFGGKSPLPHDLGERFSHNNDLTRALITKQNEDLPEGCERTIRYYAGLNELTVTPPSNEFPLINNGADVRHYLVNGDHVTTPEIVTNHLIDQGFDFFEDA